MEKFGFYCQDCKKFLKFAKGSKKNVTIFLWFKKHSGATVSVSNDIFELNNFYNIKSYFKSC